MEIQEIVQAVVSNLLQIVATLLVTLIGVGGTWLTTKIAKREDMKNVAHATDELRLATEQTVRDLQQRVVNDFKKSSADGKLTPDEITELNKELISITMSNLSHPTISVLNSVGIDISEMIRSYGEAVIQQMHE